MGITENKFRVLGDSNLYGNTKCSSYGSNVLMVDTSGKGIYIGNGTSNPTLIADNGESKYVKIEDYLDHYQTPLYDDGLWIGEGNGLDDLYVPYCSASEGGIVPAADASAGTINSQANDWVLTRKSTGAIDWYKLPSNAFSNTNTVTPYHLFTTDSSADALLKICTLDTNSAIGTFSARTVGRKFYIKFKNGNSSGNIDVSLGGVGAAYNYKLYYNNAPLTASNCVLPANCILECVIRSSSGTIYSADIVGVLGGTGGSNTYLPLSGGKIDGAGKVYFNYNVNDASSNFIQGISTTSLRINANSVIYFCIDGNNKLVLNSNNIYPLTGDNFSIGADGYRFAYGYFNNSVYAAEGFYESSDERLKDFYNNVEVDLDKLAQLPKKYFTWKKDNDKDIKPLYIGTSAQELKKLYPELVTTTNDGHLNVAYDKLSIIALKGIDVLNNKIKSLEDRIVSIEKKINI